MRVSFGRRREPRAAFRYLAEDAPSGYGDAADRLVRGLRDTGVRVEYRRWSGAHDAPPSGIGSHRRDPLPDERAARGAPTVAHLIPEHLPKVRKAIRRGPLIAHTVWETDLLPAHWPKLLNRTDRVIVPTEWNREVFEASGVTKPVVVVPHVVCDPVPGDGGVDLDLPAEAVVFYAISRWDQRKAPDAVIHAFLQAFTADDPVALVVKTTPLAQYPAPSAWGEETDISGTTMLEIARIMRSYPRPPLVRVEIEDWSPARIAGLHTRGDCFVSLTHGEGWGLGAFDAAAYGNPVVMTGWGGQLEFLEPEASFIVDYDLEPVRHWDPRAYGPDQHWAVPRLEHAAELMRQIATDLGAARRRVAPLRAKVLHDFAPARVAATLLDVVPELALVTDEGARSRLERELVTTAPARPQAGRGASRSDDLLLIGMTVGGWSSAFDNWVEMAQRHDFRYELVGRDVVEPYVPHATKWRVLRDYFAHLPRGQLVFYLDAADAFVCGDPAAVVARYRSYRAPVVFGAEADPRRGPGFDVPDPRWRHGNSGAFVGEAGVIADALRDGYWLADWDEFGHVSDQHALMLHFDQPEHRHLATVDHHRSIVQNIGALVPGEEYEQHRQMLDRHARRSPTSAVHFFGGNGASYNAFARLYGLTPVELVPTGLFAAPAPPRRDLPVPPGRGTPSDAIPRIAHFVFGLRREPEPFHLVHYLAIASCIDVEQPDEVRVHCHHRPEGPYWDLIEPHVVVCPVEPAQAVSDLSYDDPVVERYSYAHHADFVRLDVLAEHGGLYADLDTLFVRRIPERLWRAPFVIGREADVLDGDRPARPALSNALLMSMPGSAFVEAWRAEIAGAFDGTWASHSCFLANDLATRLPNDVRVEPQRTFHAFDTTRRGIALLLEHPAQDLDGVATLHLAAHLWWDEDRRDFSDVHAGTIDEEWIRTSNSTYATAARRFLPEHGCHAP